MWVEYCGHDEAGLPDLHVKSWFRYLSKKYAYVKSTLTIVQLLQHTDMSIMARSTDSPLLMNVLLLRKKTQN